MKAILTPAKRFYGLMLALGLFATAWGQVTPAPAPGGAAPAEDHSYKPVTLKLNEAGSKYIRFITWHQFWMTHTWNNPGTLDATGNPVAQSTDIALRRSRFLVYAQMSKRFLILSHWGINNQSFINGGASDGSGASVGSKKPQLFLHDAWTEFAVIPDKLHIGTGLHYWNGVSRLSSQSTLNFMTLDAPIFNWFNIEQSDQFARQYGIYAKGYLGKLDYRVSLNKPFAFSAQQTLKTMKASTKFDGNPIVSPIKNEHFAIQGYFSYNFWDKENNTLPFYVGTYLGAKKVFNVGAGFYVHPDAYGSKMVEDGVDSMKTYHQKVFAADAYLDLPLNKEKGTALNALVTYYNMDFGPNFLRNIGILNQHTAVTGTNSWAGGGNAQPTIGTGSVVYAQLGYLLPRLKNGQALMPYATVTYKNFERLSQPSTQLGIGLNYLVLSHNAKITVEYQTRPVYQQQGTEVNNTGSKGQLIVQTHIFL